MSWSKWPFFLCCSNMAMPYIFPWNITGLSLTSSPGRKWYLFFNIYKMSGLWFNCDVQNRWFELLNESFLKKQSWVSCMTVMNRHERTFWIVERYRVFQWRLCIPFFTQSSSTTSERKFHGKFPDGTRDPIIVGNFVACDSAHFLGILQNNGLPRKKTYST